MKMKKIVVIASIFTSISMLVFTASLGGCGDKSTVQERNEKARQEHMQETSPETTAEPDTARLADGTYIAEFQTDSGMFHVSEACDGKGTLNVENGEMTIHISLASKNIINLYPGLAEDAKKEGAKLLFPTEDTVTYSDGMKEEVYGFDVPVPELETEFNLALIGTKGKWYDHKVSVTNPLPAEDGDTEGKDTKNNDTESKDTVDDDTQAKNADALTDGTYSVELAFEGGSGRAEILSPATLTVTGGKAVAVVQWSSPNYDYMIVDGEKYLPVNTQGGSVFEIPVLKFDEPMNVIGDTVAMSRPHEVEYAVTFRSDTVKKK